MLYRAGIPDRSDANGTFNPKQPYFRAEAAAIITRVALSSERKTLSITQVVLEPVEKDYPIWEEGVLRRECRSTQ
jgi:hypothetical protein